MESEFLMYKNKQKTIQHKQTKILFRPFLYALKEILKTPKFTKKPISQTTKATER